MTTIQYADEYSGKELYLINMWLHSFAWCSVLFDIIALIFFIHDSLTTNIPSMQIFVLYLLLNALVTSVGHLISNVEEDQVNTWCWGAFLWHFGAYGSLFTTMILTFILQKAGNHDFTICEWYQWINKYNKLVVATICLFSLNIACGMRFFYINYYWGTKQAVFYGMLLLICLINIYFIAKQKRIIKRTIVFINLIGYPLIIAFCFLPSGIKLLYDVNNPKDTPGFGEPSPVLQTVCFVMEASYPALLACLLLFTRSILMHRDQKQLQGQNDQAVHNNNQDGRDQYVSQSNQSSYLGLMSNWSNNAQQRNSKSMNICETLTQSMSSVLGNHDHRAPYVEESETVDLILV